MTSQKSLIDAYRDGLTRAGRSPHTIKAYVHDVGAFAAWWEQTTGREFNPQAVDPREIPDYRSYCIHNDAKPASINRRLIALRRFFAWAKKQGQIPDSPFESLENVLVKEQKDTAPRWLTRPEQLALRRSEAHPGAEPHLDEAVAGTWGRSPSTRKADRKPITDNYLRRRSQ